MPLALITPGVWTKSPVSGMVVNVAGSVPCRPNWSWYSTGRNESVKYAAVSVRTTSLMNEFVAANV